MSLRNMRERNGLTAAQVANLLGVCPRTVRRWEAGEREPAEIGDLVKLARLYAVSEGEVAAAIQKGRKAA
jgi:transcriptional regulator with XRE-family HTH domain